MKSRKFLQFNGKNILFLAIDGTFWVALKPICEALNVNFDRQYKNLKSDKVLRAAYANQPMQVPGDQMRNYVCLPEKFIYGWIFRIRSNSEILQKYQLECYEVLWNHFQGSITQRQKLLQEETSDEREIALLESRLKLNEDYQKLNIIKGRQLRRGKDLKQLDKELIAENMSLWDQDFVKQTSSN